MRVVIPYQPRPVLSHLHKRTRFQVVVLHRRAGKTVYAVNEQIKSVMTCQLPRPRVAYIAPTQTQARRIVWDYALQYSATIPGIRPSSQQLTIDYPNGGRLMLLSGENFESIRGSYLDDVVIDEAADINPIAWSQVIRPALSDRKGKAIFSGTPKGRNNLLADMYSGVPDYGEDWSRHLLTWKDTGIIDPDEIEALRREMSEDEFAQEYECSWLAAIQGAYYARQINSLDDKGQIRSVEYVDTMPVHTAWDLGWRDSTVVWFFQMIAGEIRIIDLLYVNNMKFPDIIANVKARGYQFGIHIGPHDLGQHELGSGQTRQEIAMNLGFHFDVCPKISVIDGIQAVQAAIPHMWFDRIKTKFGVDALRQYRSKYDALNRVHSKNPLHDWTADFADALRYLVVYMDGGQRTFNYAPLDYSKRDKRKV